MRGHFGSVGSFGDYVERRNPSLLEYEHVPRLVSVGQRIVDGALDRVLVIMPPRYFKTEIFVRLLGGYFLRRFPKQLVGVASYGAKLAWDTSSEARDYFKADGGGVSSTIDAKALWATPAGGEMWAAGVGGPLLGFGYHLGIVDDPTDPEKAHSPTYQKRFREWWPSKFLSRQEPGNRIVVVMQRLGIEDPIDFLLRRELGDTEMDIDEAPEHWHVVVCDEIKSSEPLGEWDGPQGLPPTCTLEPDPREEGEVLAPSRFGEEEVLKLQRGSGTYVKAAQRQQRPSSPEGDFWKKDWFRIYDELPAHAYDGGWDWDLAYTKNEANSASAGVRSFRGPGAPKEFPIYIHDVDWEWLEFPELVKRIEAHEGPHYLEDKATGKSAAQTLHREGIRVGLVGVDGDKFARATDVQPVVANGRIYVRRAIYRRLLEGDRQGLLRVTVEMLLTDRGDLDVNDGFVQSIKRHVAGRTEAGFWTPSMDTERRPA